MIEEWRENLDSNFFVGAVLTDLSIAFDFIPHDLLMAKLSAYGLSSDSLCYIYSYLKDRKQCVLINNKQSEFDGIISGMPQCSMLNTSVHNFPDDNALFYNHNM